MKAKQIQKQEVLFYTVPDTSFRTRRHSRTSSPSTPHYSKWLIRQSRSELVRAMGVDPTTYYSISPAERAVELTRLMDSNPDGFRAALNKVMNRELIAVRATFTASPKNPTQRNLFNNLYWSPIDGGELTICGKYNQSLTIHVDLEPIQVTPDLIKWHHESAIMLTDEDLSGRAVIHHSITQAGNSCYSLACGCELRNDVLVVSKGARFIFEGSGRRKLVDANYHFEFNGANGSNITLPSDLDVMKFNFFYKDFLMEIASGNYIKNNQVFCAKTDAGNYVVYQDNPRRAKVLLLEAGDVLDKDDATWGNARVITTPYESLDDYLLAVNHYNATVANEEAAAAASRAARLTEMNEHNKGWYIVELPCFAQDYRRGGHKERWTNWKVLADSAMAAYDKAVEMAEQKGYFWFTAPENCQITFWGVCTDFAETCLKEDGLI